jgi:acylphosphatase
MAITIRYCITIQGRVQGVGFRYSAREAARAFGIKGFVKNLPGNEVYIEAEGERVVVDSFLEWCRKGPSRAQIETLDIHEMPPVGFSGFDIRI